MSMIGICMLMGIIISCTLGGLKLCGSFLSIHRSSLSQAKRYFIQSLPFFGVTICLLVYNFLTQ